MLIGRVIGNMVSTIKNPDYAGHKLLMVQPLTPQLQPYKTAVVAVDLVDAGEGELVVFVDEGNCGRQLLGLSATGPVKAVVVGIVDDVELPDVEAPSFAPPPTPAGP